MIVGFGRAPLEPPLPFDPQGQSARNEPVTDVDPRLSVTACVIRDDDETVVLMGADVLAHTGAFSRAARKAIATAVGCAPDDVLLNASHTHAGLWPGAKRKISGADLESWYPGERAYLQRLPALYASAARAALVAAVPARVAWGLGRVGGRIGNRRQRDRDGRILIGWERGVEVEDTVSVARFDDEEGRRLGTIVGFACHPVVLGHQVPRASSDFVGPLRETVERIDGGMCLFLQGASGDIQPREALFDARGPEVALGRRVGLEAIHAVADADPWPRRTRARRMGRWAPTYAYRSSRVRSPSPQTLWAASRSLRLPLTAGLGAGELEAEIDRLEDRRMADAGEAGASSNGLVLQLAWAHDQLGQLRRGRIRRSLSAEVWAAGIGDGVIVGVSAELFGDIGAAIRARSTAAHTFVAGCCNGVIGYVPTPEAHEQGGFEVTTAHRIYGQPAAAAPAAGARIVSAAAGLLAPRPWPAASVPEDS